jgi:hypothetical protein
MVEKDEVTGRITYRPNILGSYRDVFGRDFTEVFYTQVKGNPSTGKAEYVSLTKPLHPYECARTSLDLPTWVPSDFSHIFKKG